jgi:hypothetical protein
MDDIETPSLYEIAELAEDAGLVEERETALVVFISCIRGGLVWMRGPSRAGKDQVVDAVEFTLPDEGGFGIFKVPTSTSPTALFKKAEEMNNRKIHRYPDLASLPEHLENILKANGDGDPITHELATGTQDGQTMEQTIMPPDAQILFHASDNEKINPDDFPELRNRALMVSVDASEDLTKKINERQAKQEAGLIEDNIDPERAQEIRDYVKTIPKNIYIDGSGDLLNPVAPALDNQNPLPQKFVEARQDFQRLLKFMRSIALFHYKDRMRVMGEDGSPRMLVAPKDVWLAMRVFGQDMIMSALNLRDRDLTMLRLMREDMSRGWSKAGLLQELQDVGLNVTSRDVTKSLNGMLNKGYVRKDQNQSPVLWSATSFAGHATVDVKMDWEEVVEDTKETARNALDGDHAEEYISRFCESDGLFVRNPLDGRTIDITESSELEDMVDRRLEVEEEVLDGALEDEDPAAQNQEQGFGNVIQG